jgi:hypothetical protein
MMQRRGVYGHPWASENHDTTKKSRKSPKTDQPAKSDSMLARASREGDQFHYVWAARRCLRLLSPSSGLVAVTIEGASSLEFPNGEAVVAGEELIDGGEYYRSQDTRRPHSRRRVASPISSGSTERYQ